MARAWLYLVGPELVWILICLGTWWFGAQNQPPTEAGSRRVEWLIWWLPALAVFLTFATLAVPMPSSRWWTYLRAGLTALPGIVVISTIICNHVDYGDSRNSGLGAARILGIVIGGMAFVAALVMGALALWLGPKLMRP